MTQRFPQYPFVRPGSDDTRQPPPLREAQGHPGISTQNEMLSRAFVERPGTCGLLGGRNNPTRQSGGSTVLGPRGALNDGIAVKQEETLIGPLSSEGDPDPVLITVDLYRKNTNPSDQSAVPRNSNFQVTANLAWGSGKGKCFATVDFVHGQRISLAASFIEVTAQYTLNNVDNTGPLVLVAAGASYGTTGSNHAQLSLPPQTLVGGASTGFLQVPDFARKLFIMDDIGNSASGYTVTFLSEANAGAINKMVLPLYIAGFTTAGIIEEIPVPNGFDYVQITNNDPANARRIYPVWKLFL